METIQDQNKAILLHEFFHALFQGNNRKIVDILNQGIDINYIDKKGNTALHYVEGLDKTKLLIKNKINLDVVNLQGFSALELMLRQERFNEAQYLIDSGANYKLVKWDEFSESIRDQFLLPIITKEEKEILEKNNNKKIKL